MTMYSGDEFYDDDVTSGAFVTDRCDLGHLDCEEDHAELQHDAGTG